MMLQVGFDQHILAYYISHLFLVVGKGDVGFHVSELELGWGGSLLSLA